ncbi:formate dehydrogenase subunit alpha, partial [archaeon]
MKLVKSVCPYCGVGCSLFLKIDKGKIAGVQPDREHPVSKGELCIKGATVDKVVNSKKRLRYPLIKKNGKLVKTTWEKAIKTVADKFFEIKMKYGQNSLGVFSSAKCTNEENYLIQKFARICLGTNNIDNCTRLCHAPSLSAMNEELHRGAMTNSYEDLPEAECILIIGSNPAVTQPIGFHRLLECQRRGGRIITVDVRKTETAEKSNLFVQINPGTDVFFAAALLKILIAEGKENSLFICENVSGYGEMKKYLEKYPLEIMTKTVGVSETLIKNVALIYASAKSSAIINGMGVTQQPFGVESVLALANLALLTGNIGKPGSGINPLRGCNNVQGSCDMGCLPDFYPGYAPLAENTVKRFERFWNAELPVEKGMAETEMIEAIGEKILGMYIIGENPMMSHPNLNEAENNLKDLEFLVVQDMFLTETARMADVVLPAASFAEKTGTVTNTERRVQIINQALKPEGCKTDFEIVNLIAKDMGFKKQFACRKPEDVFSEIRNSVPQYSGLTYSRLAKRSMQWPCNKENPEGTKIIFSDGKKNNFVFYPVVLKYARENAEYPLALISHRSLEQYNTGTFSRKVEALNKIRPENFLEISRNDADRFNVADNEIVKVVSEFGEIRIRAKISDRVSAGVVAAENHFCESRLNRLTSSVTDPVSKT